MNNERYEVLTAMNMETEKKQEKLSLAGVRAEIRECNSRDYRCANPLGDLRRFREKDCTLI
jgi:hypothetical protein